MASTYDFLYLKTLVKQKLQGDNFWSDEQIEDAINESQDDLAIFTKANLVSQSLALVGGQDHYPFPTDALVIDGVNINGVECDEITAEEWRRYGGLTPNNIGVPGAPSSYAIQGMEIILYPKPNDTTLPALIFYIPKPVDLDLDTDVPVIPRVFTKAWVHLAVSHLLEMDADRREEALYHFNMYMQRREEHAVNQNASRKRKFRNVMPRGVR